MATSARGSAEAALLESLRKLGYASYDDCPAITALGRDAVAYFDDTQL